MPLDKGNVGANVWVGLNATSRIETAEALERLRMRRKHLSDLTAVGEIFVLLK
jgi:hypothetical protein